jgi:hypothetical protein
MQKSVTKRERKYSISRIYQAIREESRREKSMILLSSIMLIVLIFFVVPMAILFFIGLFLSADLPLFDHGLIGLFSHTRLFLMPYTILLVFYFAVMYRRDRKQHQVNGLYFKKAKYAFLTAMVIMLLPYLLHDHLFLSMLYAVCFVLTVYYLSLTYYDVPLQKAFNIQTDLYRSDDLGWTSSMGMLDNPFSVEDDINRTQFFVQSSTLGIDMIVSLIQMIVKSLIFVSVGEHSRTMQEAARLFSLILEQKLEGDYGTFSPRSKIVLEILGYASFRDGRIVLYKRGKALEKTTRTKEPM